MAVEFGVDLKFGADLQALNSAVNKLKALEDRAEQLEAAIGRPYGSGGINGALRSFNSQLSAIGRKGLTLNTRQAQREIGQLDRQLDNLDRTIDVQINGRVNTRGAVRAQAQSGGGAGAGLPAALAVGLLGLRDGQGKQTEYLRRIAAQPRAGSPKVIDLTGLAGKQRSWVESPRELASAAAGTTGRREATARRLASRESTHEQLSRMLGAPSASGGGYQRNAYRFPRPSGYEPRPSASGMEGAPKGAQGLQFWTTNARVVQGQKTFDLNAGRFSGQGGIGEFKKGVEEFFRTAEAGTYKFAGATDRLNRVYQRVLESMQIPYKLDPQSRGFSVQAPLPSQRRTGSPSLYTPPGVVPRIASSSGIDVGQVFRRIDGLQERIAAGGGGGGKGGGGKGGGGSGKGGPLFFPGGDGGRGIKAVGDAAKGATASVTGLGAAVRSALGPLSLFAGGFAIQKLAADFSALDTNIRRLGTAGGDSAALNTQLGQIEKELGGVSNKAELAAAAYQSLSAGFSKTADIASIITASTKAAVGGLANQEEVTSVLVKTLNAYGLEASKAAQVTDVISKAVEVGNVEWSDYTQQLGKVSGMAAASGVSFEELNAFIAASTKGGATAEQAFTGLSGVLTGLMQPTKESQEAAALLGVKWNLAGLNAKGLEGLLKDLNAAQAKNPELAARMVGGAESVRGAFAAAGQGGKLFGDSLKAIDKAAGKTDQDFKIMAASFANQVKKIDTAFKNLGEALGKAFGPKILEGLKDFAGLLDNATKFVQGIPQPVSDAAVELAKFATAMLGVHFAIKAVIGLRAMYAAAMLSIAGTTAATGGAAAVATPKIAALAGALYGTAAAGALVAAAPWIAAAAGVIALGKAVYDTNETFRNFVDNVGGVIASDFRVAVDGMATDASESANAIQIAYEDLKEKLDPIGASIRKMFKSVFKDTSDAATDSAVTSTNAFSDFFGSLQSGFAGLGSTISDWWEGLPAPVRAHFEGNSLSLGIKAAAYGQSVGVRASAPNAQASGMYGRYAPGSMQQATPATSASDRLKPKGNGGVGTNPELTNAYNADKGSGGSKASFQPSSKAKALMAAAQKLGISPLDLATIIGFETGGSYSPSQWGGAGGNYMGLIQFGPNERKAYGAHQGQSFEEQVQGPVVRFFQDRFKGVGMSTQGASLEDLYTTVLAGNPKANRNSRDSFGTSPRSGVKRMAPHRQKSLGMFFGGDMKNVGYDSSDAGADAAQAAENRLESLKQGKELSVQYQQMLSTSAAITEDARQRLEVQYQYQDRQQKINELQDAGQRKELTALNNKIKAGEIQKLDNALLVEKARLLEGALRPIADENELLEARLAGTEKELIARREIAALTNAGMAPDAAKALVAKNQQLKAADSDPVTQLVRQWKTELGGTREMVASLADTVQGELGSAMSNALTGLIQGTQTAEQAFSQMFANIGKAFIDMATQMIAKALIMKVLGIIGGGYQGLGSTFSGNSTLSSGFSGTGSAVGGWSFAGGGYTGDAPRSGGVDGQGGFPAILHPQETVVDHTQAMDRFRPVSGGSAADGGESGEAGGGSGLSLSMSFQTTRFMDRDWVDQEQLEVAMAQAAKRGAEGGRAKVMGDLRNKRSTRARVGV